jgi:hypothetical protein
LTRIDPARRVRPIVLAAVVAVVVATTGFAAVVHGHLPAVDGWHDTAPPGAPAHDDGLNSCSICRLAHETSSAPTPPGVVPEPLRLIALRTSDRPTIARAVLAREHSPRAPPCLASC